MENPIVQTPASTNQIEAPKPSVSKTPAVISSPIANSMNGGHWKTVSWQYVMGGQHIQKGQLNLNIQMLTPKTPAYQRLKANVQLIYVPHERVWKKYLEYIGQRGGTSVEKIKEKPNLGGLFMPYAKMESHEERFVPIMNTTAWRDHWISSYIPRIGYIDTFEAVTPSEDLGLKLPPVDALPMRAFIAAYNDVLRNREFDNALEEFTEMDTVTEQELKEYMPSHEIVNSICKDVQNMRCRRNDSYYTNYRTELQGIDIEAPDQTDEDKALLNWMNYEAKADLARSTAEDAQAREIDVFAKIRGAKKLTEGRVQVLARKTFDINYSAITQSAYNTNEGIEEKFQVMGQQGAYSYTNIELPIGEDIMFLSDGTIHLVMSITADTIFESAIPRRRMTINALDEYRPELEEDKLDVIYEYEFGNTIPRSGTLIYTLIKGYKRRFSEYYMGNQVIAGDMMTEGYYQIYNKSEELTVEEKLESNNTYQFFEHDANWGWYYDGNSMLFNSKKSWLDYTDLAINKNQAIINPTEGILDISTNQMSYVVQGQNQIFFVGEYVIATTLPISDKIKNNYTEWGEH